MTTTTEAISKIEAHEFAGALMLMKLRAGQLGFFKTMHALEPATQAIGWEMAEQILDKKPSSDRPRRSDGKEWYSKEGVWR